MTSPDFEDYLREGAAALGLRLPESAVGRMRCHYDLLLHWGRGISLTSLREDGEIVVNHFLDSLSAVTVIGVGGAVLDAGSGAGFPGAVIASSRPDLEITLLDSSQKKVHFLKELRRSLGLPRLRVERGQLGSPGAPALQRRDYGWVVARALATRDILPAALDCLGSEGRVLLMKGPNWAGEPGGSPHEIEKAGSKIERVIEFRLPFSGAERSLLVLRRG